MWPTGGGTPGPIPGARRSSGDRAGGLASERELGGLAADADGRAAGRQVAGVVERVLRERGSAARREHGQRARRLGSSGLAELGGVGGQPQSDVGAQEPLLAGDRNA